ncbi:DUF4031 domain-containing protein [Leucobacter sp. UT-8R-CII-1-4]|uniref:DUF4031 domain-containing protein n=1 Tax=Leucobacter sp. UT-8R-CII-1-4 TaxID=3040075 RepID=UPI0024A83523|nr:DUF4031 domain-containing protein [Leucobacter sp. UT-8R-CII-1-4]MDI6021944.1 DUF4031 domain-containing protein [Leucobacter sp. UT-8R-CII-1-4]
MAILIDPPAWPAHGTLWSHLISDSDYDELHLFAAKLGAPRRGFDLDHYDVPASLYERAVLLGAQAVTAKDVVHRLRGSGLRVRGVDREAVRPLRRRHYLQNEWLALGTRLEVSSALDPDERNNWHALGANLLTRWNEPHRSYHDERHLEDVLLALNHLQVRGEMIAPETLLAAWFHDAVYEGSAGEDEAASAELALRSLTDAEFALDGALVASVGDHVLATIPAREVADPPASLAHLLDADLSIFAASPTRYADYASSVRREYAHVSDSAFANGRAQILESYLLMPKIYRSDAAKALWEDRARENLRSEFAELSKY